VTDRDRRLAMIAIWVGVAAGTAAACELAWWIVRWVATGRP
jgi:hypothetical protein